MANSTQQTHYQVFGLPRTATAEEIKKQYKKLAIERHPDKNNDNPNATAAFQLVSNNIVPLIPLQ
jgi:curved DNA-binding protein CbpA